MELPPGAGMAEIKSAYRSLAKKYHPDLCPGADGECHEKMVEINAAYDLLLTSQGVSSSPGDRATKAAQEYERWWWEHFGEGSV